MYLLMNIMYYAQNLLETWFFLLTKNLSTKHIDTRYDVMFQVK